MNVNVLGPDHKGLMWNPRFLTENGRGYAFMRRQMNDHLVVLAREYYKGNVTIVDEFLQLYCYGREARESLKAAQSIQPDYEI